MKQLFYKIIYNQHINHILRNLNKLFVKLSVVNVKLPPSGIVKISIKKNKLHLATNQTSYLTFLVFWYGADSFEYTPIFKKLSMKVNSFMDIGANLGYYSLIAAKLNPDSKIVSFEPAIGSLHYLNKNIKINNLSNIKIEPIALSHKTGTIDFYEMYNQKYNFLKHNLGGESNAGSKTNKEKFVVNTVQTLTLDNYCKESQINTIDLIKIDTEGTEHLILKHATDIICGSKPIIICETLFNTIETELEEIMKGHGYDFYNHTNNGLRKVDTIVRSEDDGIRNCFFVHPTKFHLIEEFVH